LHTGQKAMHGVRKCMRADGTAIYMVEVHVGKRCVHFGTYDDHEFACLVADYVARELTKTGALNYPDRELPGKHELKVKIREMYSQAISTASFSEDLFEAARKEFWESVEFGLVFVCCCCHQTWFLKCVRPVTESFILKVTTCASAAAIIDVSRWICRTCYKFFSQGRVPSICHLHYDPFSALPEELKDMSSVENDLIALKIAVYEVEGFGSKCSRWIEEVWAVISARHGDKCAHRFDAYTD
jgi:hypothetical protein